MQPIYDYYSVLVYSANPSNVDTVIIDGKILVKNKKLIDSDDKFLQTINELKKMKYKILNTAKKL